MSLILAERFARYSDEGVKKGDGHQEDLQPVPLFRPVSCPQPVAIMAGNQTKSGFAQCKVSRPAKEEK